MRYLFPIALAGFALIACGGDQASKAESPATTPDAAAAPTPPPAPAEAPARKLTLTYFTMTS